MPAPFPLARLDRRWRYFFVNAAFAALMCVAPSDVIGRICWDVFPWLRTTPAATVMRRGMRTRRVQTARVASAYKTGYSVILTIVPNDRGGIDVMTTYSADPDVEP